MRLQGVKAILFDLDGTLVDSSEAIVSTVEKALESRGLKCESAEVVKMIGLPLEDIFSALKPNLSRNEVWQLVYKYREYYMKHHLERTKIHSSTQVLLRTLRASGFKLGIITTKYKEPVMDVLSHFGISKLFDVIVTGYEVEKRKPAPDIVLEAAKRLGVTSKQCVVVGDSPVDVQAGKRAGAFTIALLSNTYNRRLLESTKPTVIIEELQAILKFL